MSSELLVEYVAIPRRTEINWEAAVNHVLDASLNDGVKKLFIESFKVATAQDPNAVVNWESDVVAFASQAIDVVKAIIDGARDDATMIMVPYQDTVIDVYLIAMESCGEPLVGTDELEFFYGTGMAKAAGFLTFRKPPNVMIIDEDHHYTDQ